MDTYKIVVLNRGDLRRNTHGLNLEQITLYDFEYTLEREIIHESTFIVFVDSPRHYVILKNRYAEDSKETNALLDYLNLEHD